MVFFFWSEFMWRLGLVLGKDICKDNVDRYEMVRGEGMEY